MNQQRSNRKEHTLTEMNPKEPEKVKWNLK